MELQEVRRVEAATWRRILFYVDLAVILAFAVSLIQLVRHTFRAGILYEQGALHGMSATMWLVAADTAFLVGSLAWIFYRFFRHAFRALARPF